MCVDLSVKARVRIALCALLQLVLFCLCRCLSLPEREGNIREHHQNRHAFTQSPGNTVKYCKYTITKECMIFHLDCSCVTTATFKLLC